MTKRTLTQSELQTHLEQQLAFVKRSAASYDAGYDDEAKRLAVTIRVLLHDTNNSHSVLHQLGRKETLRFHDSAHPYDPRSKASHSGLVKTAMQTTGPSRPRPTLDDLPVPPRNIAFAHWWDGIVFVDNAGTKFTRRDIVLAAANQDGGAHVDPGLDTDYDRLTRGNALGWFDVSPTTGPKPSADQVPAAIRQIAHEVLKTLDPNYKCAPAPNPTDAIYVMGSAMTEGGQALPIPAFNPTKNKIGRNDECPCGSGVKYKRCHGK